MSTTPLLQLTRATVRVIRAVCKFNKLAITWINARVTDRGLGDCSLGFYLVSAVWVTKVGLRRRTIIRNNTLMTCLCYKSL